MAKASCVNMNKMRKAHTLRRSGHVTTTVPPWQVVLLSEQFVLRLFETSTLLFSFLFGITEPAKRKRYQL